MFLPKFHSELNPIERVWGAKYTQGTTATTLLEDFRTQTQ